MPNIRKFGNSGKRSPIRPVTLPYNKLKMLNAGCKGLWEIPKGVPTGPFSCSMPGESVPSGSSMMVSGSFKKPAGSTGNQSVSGLGFSPKALIFYTTNIVAADEGTNQQHADFCLGISDGTTDASTWTGSEDSRTTMEVNREFSLIYSINMRDGANFGALRARASVNSLDSDGFTVNWETNSDSIRDEIKFVAFGGSAITDVKVGHYTQRTTTGLQSVNTGINTADIVMNLGSSTTTPDTLNDHGETIIGLGCSGDYNYLSCVNRDNVIQSISTRYLNNLLFNGNRNSQTGANLNVAVFSGFTTTGFNQTWSTVNGVAYQNAYLTIKGGTWACGEDLFPTTTGTKSFTTSGTPEGVVLIGVNRVSSGAFVTSAQVHFGATDGVNNHGVSYSDRDGRVTSEVGKLSSSTKCIITPQSDIGTDDEAIFDSFALNTFTLDWTKNEGNAKEFMWFTVAP